MKKRTLFSSRKTSAHIEPDSRQMGDACRDNRDWSGASKHYSDYLDVYPDDFAIRVQLGNCSKESGDFELAEETYVRAIKLNAQDADVRVQLGHLLKITGRFDEAVDSYGIAATIDPTHRDAAHERDALLAILKNSNKNNPALIDFPVPRFSSLKDLALYLRKYPKRFQMFQQYFTDFIPPDSRAN